MNRVILGGRFTRDPESRMSAAGLEISRFSLAVQSHVFDKVKNEREVEFINCVAFGNQAAAINKYSKKGDYITATGRIKNGSYEDKEGIKRYTTDVIIDNFEFVGSRRQDAGDSNFEIPFKEEETVTPEEKDPYSDLGEEITLSDQDLPF